jgi:hypothetical protein
MQDARVQQMNRGENAETLAMMVRHASLKRYGDGGYKSVCPVCKEGILFVRRHPETLRLLATDRCSFCAQLFIYADTWINGEEVVKS